jgi:Reverse transcriptase (RNA-dependent DNA polymerase)
MEKGTFIVLRATYIPPCSIIFGMRFVDKQNKGDGSLKSRLCVQAFKDNKHALFVAAPTMQRSSMSLFFSIYAMMKFEIHLLDISQAFLQSDSFLQRDIYARPPKELDVTVGCIVKVLRPLYGVPESPIHWCKTCHGHHTKELCMTPTATDPCFF